jgi:hypothetical protein
MKKTVTSAVRVVNLFTLIFFLVCGASTAIAQPANTYVFSAFNTPYSSITGTVPNIQGDDLTQTGIPLGFTFNFAGTNYTTVAMCSNGFMSLNNSPSNQLTNSQANAAGIGPMLMPLWDDLDGTSGTPSTYAYYTTTGVAPNRIFTLECQNWAWNYTGTTGCISFEVKLYETSNIVDFTYEQGANTYVSPSATIGIFNSNTDFQTLPDVTANPVPSIVTFYTNIADKPATGQVYRWAPQFINCVVPGNNYCGGDVVNITYSSLGIAFFAGNVFTVQLSDATGSFASPTNIGTLTSTATSGTIVCTIPTNQAAGTGYRFRIVSSNQAFTGRDNGVDITINPSVVPSVTIVAIPGDTICNGDNVTFAATAINGGPSPTYQWYINGNPVGGNTQTYSTATLVDGDVVTCEITSNAQCVVPTTATSNAITMVVYPNVTPTITITANPGNSICIGQSVTFTTTVTNEGPNPTYVWKVNGFPVGGNTPTYTTTTLTNGDIVTCELTSNAPCVLTPTVVSNAITMTVNPNVTPTITISVPDTSVCAGDNITFTATVTNGGPTPAYQWYVNGNPVGGNTATYTTTTLANGDQVTCELTSSAVCATPAVITSNTLTMTVNPVVAADVTVAANPGNNICAGTSVTFTATPTNGGPTPTYIWFVNATQVGSNSPTYTTTTLANGDVVTCKMASSTPCAVPDTAVSTDIIMTVNPNLTADVSIAANPGNNICAGTLVTFTATATNGGPSPTYQWYLNGNPVGGNNPTYTNNALASGDVVTCEMTSSAPCATPSPATSNDITMIVTPTVLPVVSVANNTGNTICAGTNVVFTATPSNGGPTPSYQWYVNGNPVGSNSASYSTTSLANGDVVTCELTSTAVCATPMTVTSTPVTMTVNPLVTPAVTITASPGDTICNGTTVTFTPTPVNGGASPTYQWFVNGLPVAIGPTYSSNALVNTDIITCNMSSSAVCPSPSTVTSNVIVMYVTSVLTPVVSISAAPGDTVCVGSTATYSASPTNGGTSPSYQWYLNGSPVGSNSPTYANNTLVTGDIVHCDMTSSLPCPSPATVSSNDVTMYVNGITVPFVSLSTSPGDTVCDGTPITYTATPVNGGPAPTYLWRKNGSPVGGPSDTYTYLDPLAGDVISCTLISSDPCPSPATVTVESDTIGINPLLNPVLDMEALPSHLICTGSDVTFVATADSAGPAGGLSFQWMLNGNIVGTNSPTWTGSMLNSGDQVYCIMTTTAPCVTSSVDTSVTDTVAWFNAGYLAGSVGTTESNTINLVQRSVVSYTDCDLISTITPNGANPVAGSTTFKVTLDPQVNSFNGQPYVQRHYDIDPANNAANATATIELYAYENEFIAYNNVAAGMGLPLLPLNRVDNGNVRITAFHGTGTAPGNYPGPVEEITPVVTWDTAGNWWVMTFNVTSFSGFYIHTGSAGPLAVSNVNNGDFDLMVWPNPAQDKIQVQISGKRAAHSYLEITDLVGKTVLTAPLDNNKAIVDMSGLASGMYLLKYTDDARTQTVKITKQ